MNPAPVALFAYRRPDHTRRLLESFLANPEARSTRVYAFLDGPKHPEEQAGVAATREVIETAGLSHLSVVERRRNMGLARSVIDGVTRLCAEHGRVIVLEDDLLVAPTFLEYMNAALERYVDAERVYGISGFMYPVELRARTDAIFLPFISSWGWGTWARAWRAFDPAARGYAALRENRAMRMRFDLDGHYEFYAMLEAWKEGHIDSWAIRWYLSVFLRGGLTLFPGHSLVENRGFEVGATHCPPEAPRHLRAVARAFPVRAFPEPVVDDRVYGRLKRFMGRDGSLRSRARALAWSVLRPFSR